MNPNASIQDRYEPLAASALPVSSSVSTQVTAGAPSRNSWTDAGIDPRTHTVLDLFSRAVRRSPGSIALVDATSSMTYAELWNYADAFRRRLTELGLQPGDMVGVAARRSLATVAAIVGIVMAGGCYIPIEMEEFSAPVLAEIKKTAGVRTWIADAKARRAADPALWEGCAVVPVEEMARPVGTTLAEISPAAIHADSPIYVMFTSGSTGVPKGVLVPHRAVARLVVGQEFIKFGPEQTFLLHSPLSFDASTLEFWGSLLHGSRLVVAPDRALGLDDYTQLILRQGVTTLWLTAAIFHLAAEHTPELFAPLELLVFGGDVIAPRHVERMRALYPGLRMVNGYGPTENTTFTCCYRVPRHYRAEGTLPIGSPVAHTTVYILDAQHKPVATGEQGELATGGAGVALGYLGLPEATAERFLADTFSGTPGALLYLTGDNARQLPDGTIEFLGRIDRQVKIAGHRVELAAVEAALAESPLVAAGAVMVLTVASGEKQLVACVELTSPTTNAEAALRAWLQQRLSRTSTPQHWIFLEKLPINANGKVDRAALQALCEMKLLGSKRSSASVVAQPEQEPTTETAIAGNETTENAPQTMAWLQQMWSALLGRHAVGTDENFFDLGGTSLLLIEMHARLQARFASVPSLVEMFEFSTPRTLAARLAGQQIGAEAEVAQVRGERQRAAMLARRPAMHRGKVAAPNAAAEEESR